MDAILSAEPANVDPAARQARNDAWDSIEEQLNAADLDPMIARAATMIMAMSRHEGYSILDALREAERYVEMGIVAPADPALRRPRQEQGSQLPGV